MFQGKNLLTIFLFSLLTSGLRAEPLADSVATLDLPGRGQFGQCTEFADALSGWLSAHGQSSQIIYYAYKSGLARHSLAHAIVAWERDGQLWAMGNESGEPRVLRANPADESIEVAQRYDSRAFIASRRNGKTPVAPLITSATIAGLEPVTPRVLVTPPAAVVHAAPLKRAIAHGAPMPAGPLSVAAAPRFFTDKNGTQYLIGN